MSASKSFFDTSFIHTIEMHIRKRDGIDLDQQFVDKKPPLRITQAYWDSNRKGMSFRLNPNHEGKISSQTANRLTYGNCPSSAQLELIMQHWALHNGFKRTDLNIKRVDFAIDCKTKGNAAIFKKLSELLITSLVVKHGTNRKDQYYCSDIIERRPKSIAAKAIPFEFTCYDKQTQSPRNETIMRLELRYKADLRYKGDHSNSIPSMLKNLSKEVASLANYYEKTLFVLSLQLYNEFMELQNNCIEQLSPYQFLAQNTDRVFSRMQVENFFVLIGKDEKQANNCTKYFSDHFGHFYVNKSSYKLLIKQIRKHIKNYITSNAVFADYSVNCK